MIICVKLHFLGRVGKNPDLSRQNYCPNRSMHRHILLFSALLCACITCACGQIRRPASPGGATTVVPPPPQPVPDFLPTLPSMAAFQAMAGKPLSEKYGNVSCVKVVYRIRSQELYFMHSTRYQYHYDFCSEFLQVYNDHSLFNIYEYSAMPQRRFVLANLNYYAGSNQFALEFFANDYVHDTLVKAVYDAIAANTFIDTQLKVLINSPRAELRAASMAHSVGKLPSISVDSIYAGQQYQALVQGTTYGYLRRLPSDALEKAHLGPRDIVVTDGLPMYFPLVAGILTGQFQTPLCHVNLLSGNRGTPNAALKTAWRDPRLQQWEGKPVKYSVLPDSAVIQPATEAEVAAFWRDRKPAKTITLPCNTTINGLISASELRYKHVSVVGGKAANFGELTQIRLKGNRPLPLPEGAFALPFFYYHQHLNHHGINRLIDTFLTQSATLNQEQLAAVLKRIRDTINHAPLDTALIRLVETHMRQAGPWTRYRFRSSTNAEDIPGFNGAGLYTSRTGALNDTVQTVERAIKKVWASLWLLRAFEERAFFGIDQRSVAMGILAHRAFGTEAANGVAITRHLYRPDYPAFIVNAQVGETSIVLPEDSARCDQFVLHVQSLTAETSARPHVEYIAHSSLTNGQPVLSPSETMELAECLKAIKYHFYQKTPLGQQANSYNNFGMDVEFKLDQGTRKLYIKQARAY